MHKKVSAELSLQSDREAHGWVDVTARDGSGEIRAEEDGASPCSILSKSASRSSTAQCYAEHTSEVDAQPASVGAAGEDRLSDDSAVGQPNVVSIPLQPLQIRG